MLDSQIPISLITTFYNEEVLLSRCLDSIANQTFKNFELILINDGSTDTSIKIATSYIKKFKYIKLLTIENSGLAEARNIGLKNCSGSYITFLDADDTLHSKAMETFWNALKLGNKDLIFCNFSLLSDGGSNIITTKWNINFSEIKTMKDFLVLFYKERIIETVWGKLFKAEIAKEIRFIKGIWFEDRPYFVEFLLKSKTIAFIPDKLLNIYCRESSITRRVLSEKRLRDCHRIFTEELNILNRYKVAHLYKVGVFKTALGYLTDNYLIQIIDKNKIKNYNKVCTLYTSYLQLYKKAIKKEKLKINLKDQLIILALSMPNYLGWKLSNFIFKIIKRKRLLAIVKIKNL